jgi:hypothetical protein
MIYVIINDQARFKIEYTFSDIKSIFFLDDFSESAIDLTCSPKFFIGSLHTVDFTQCSDFTEDKQASRILTHYLGGNLILRSQLSTLLSLETFTKRHHFSSPGESVQVQREIQYDEAPTDSGYASMANFRYRQNGEQGFKPGISGSGQHSPLSQKGKDVDEDETQTICSTSSNIVPETVQKSIAHVCNDIHNNIWQAVDAASYKSLAGRIPGLIKAFAIRLGTDTSNGLNQRIMHFVYKHHR